ncbi:MAG: fructose-6-phosphate aldolase [Bacteroidia bacterium]|nr:fructose-6-phosphate aldolase [Bacteroidia bacterium]
MYILKIKGKAKIPDYVQLRADDFTLKAYVRLDRPEKGFEKCGLADRIPELMQLLSELDFGVVHKID